jgi:MFS family permease
MKSSKLYPIYLILTLVLLSIVDNGIPALFETLEVYLSVDKAKLLELIAWCSVGIVIGMFFFSTKINSSTFIFFNISLFILTIVSTGFVSLGGDNIIFLNIGRFILGLCIGLCSSIAWWFSFNKAKNSNYFNILIMTSRPISIALGILTFFYMTKIINWKLSYTLISMLGPVLMIIQLRKEKFLTKDIPKKGLLEIYTSIFKNNRSLLFYGSLLTNAMGYLGFFVLIPFIANLEMSLKSIFLFMGVIEIVGTLLSKYTDLNKKVHFMISSIVLIIIPLLLFVINKSNAIIYLLPFYLLAVRIYIVNIANMIPDTFSYLDNKDLFGVCGSLIGVFAWLGLGLISFFFSKFLVTEGTNQAYIVLFTLNFISVAMLIKLRSKVIL